MKKYGICFLIVLAVALISFVVGYGITSRRVQYEQPIPNTTYEAETVTENRVVINQESVAPITEAVALDRYLLISETGYLLVFEEDNYEACMQTHIPLSDFPEEEQVKLREGIWFETMMEVFFYLESYTS